MEGSYRRLLQCYHSFFILTLLVLTPTRWTLGLLAQYTHSDSLKKPLYLYSDISHVSLTFQKEDDNNSGSGDPPKKKPTRLAIGMHHLTHLTRKDVKRSDDLSIGCLRPIDYDDGYSLHDLPHLIDPSRDRGGL